MRDREQPLHEPLPPAQVGVEVTRQLHRLDAVRHGDVGDVRAAGRIGRLARDRVAPLVHDTADDHARTDQEQDEAAAGESDGQGHEVLDLDAEVDVGDDTPRTVGLHHHHRPVPGPKVPGDRAGAEPAGLPDPEALGRRRAGGGGARGVVDAVRGVERVVVHVVDLFVRHPGEVALDVGVACDADEDRPVGPGRAADPHRCDVAIRPPVVGAG